MFRATFLGHQGWLFSTGSTNVLLDPLLTDRFGHGGLVGAVYPPRRLDLEAFPAIDAVILTHEHDDHFDIPSLNRLDRRIPIYMPRRSSAAAHGILSEMGFVWRPLEPGQEMAVGDLRYRTFAADHTQGRNSDEWDVFPFVVRDTGGHGNFMSSIDVQPTPEMLSGLRGVAETPGIWCVANNVTSSTYQTVDGPPSVRSSDTTLLANVMMERYAALERQWGTPGVTAVCGTGWSFEGDRSWINRVAFPIESERLCEVLGTRRPGEVFMAAVPGQTLALVDGAFAPAPESEPFIAALPRSQWPLRSVGEGIGPLEDYGPACGRECLEEGQWESILEELRDFARYLYGTPAFRGLHSLASPQEMERRPAVCFSLRTGREGGRRVLVYEPSACGFVESKSPDPIAEFVSGIECWATDLLALLTGEIGTTAICYAGRLRVWNASPQRVRISPHDLWMFGHPLRRPGAAANLYQRLLAAEPTGVPRVRSAIGGAAGAP